MYIRIYEFEYIVGVKYYNKTCATFPDGGFLENQMEVILLPSLLFPVFPHSGWLHPSGHCPPTGPQPGGLYLTGE